MKSVTLNEILRLARSNWRKILLWGACVSVVAFLISLAVPNKYSARATLLPLVDNQSGSGIMALAEYLPGLDMLPVPGKSPTELYPDIMKSDSLMLEILAGEFRIHHSHKEKTISMYDYLGKKDRDSALKKLASIVAITTNKKTGIIQIAATTTDPELSAEICNRFVDRLDNFNKSRRKTAATYNREFIEKRLAEINAELTAAEESLKVFRQHNMNYYRATDPELILLENRLTREVELKTQICLTLSQQYELAAIQEKKESPVVQVLDYARPPTSKCAPSRSKIALAGFIIGILMSLALIVYESRLPEGIKILHLKSPAQNAKSNDFGESRIVEETSIQSNTYG